MRMRAAVLLASLLLAGLGGPCAAQTATPASGPGLNDEDRTFLRQAGYSNRAEVAMGQLASRMAHGEVRELGRWMASAYGFASRELTSITQAAHLPGPQDELGSNGQSAVDDLKRQEDVAFERTYLDDVFQELARSIESYRREAMQGRDPFVRSFAQNMVPAMEEHLSEVQFLQQALFHAGAPGAGAAADILVRNSAGSTKPTGMPN